MPELPEVETMCRGIRAIEGRRIANAQRTSCARKLIRIEPRIDRLRRRVVDTRVDRVERLGKRVVLVLDSGDRLVFEPRMTGLVLLESPPTKEHLRFEVTFAGGRPRRLWFWDQRGLGQIHLYTAEHFRALTADGRIGPDALAVDCEELKRRLAGRKTPVKVALMNQAWLAGVGNLYASEILYVARIDPRRPCDELTARQWSRIHEAMRMILQTAIEYEGSTLSDGTYRNALNNPGQYQTQHRVYDRAGQKCPTCRRARIVRIVQAQRSTFFCPRCQR